MKRELIVRYQRLAGYLMQRGFVLLDMRPNPEVPHRNVFIFRESSDIKAAISEFKRE
ncbi:DUF5659 domain-containing protein [Paenibacillus sp.]|uniref:DUF5659 domain-containing protein n=1 Tax=Paenibacillus sp. TaxID=58172 RepID=UPI0039C96721